MKILTSKQPLITGLCIFLTAAFAQNSPTPAQWPTKPVRIVVPYAAGGTSDNLGRMVALGLQALYKQGVVVDNKAGGGGVIGSQFVSKSAPDGYSLLISGIGSQVIASAGNNMDTMKEYTHIAYLGGPPLVLVVNPDLPVQSVKGLVEYVKGVREGLSWGSPGIGTHGHLIGELFAAKTGINQTHINYKGAAPAIADLIGNQIQATFTTYTSASAFIKSGKARALAVTSKKRLPDLPSVPTFAELGYPELTSTTWFAVSGPPGMPSSLVEQINKDIRTVLKTEIARKQLTRESIESQDMSSQAFTEFIKSELDKWVPLANSSASMH
jgi:tripartite-type tricarboxylate transporter receptor subunit TctC